MGTKIFLTKHLIHHFQKTAIFNLYPLFNIRLYILVHHYSMFWDLPLIDSNFNKKPLISTKFIIYNTWDTYSVFVLNFTLSILINLYCFYLMFHLYSKQFIQGKCTKNSQTMEIILGIHVYFKAVYFNNTGITRQNIKNSYSILWTPYYLISIKSIVFTSF